MEKTLAQLLIDEKVLNKFALESEKECGEYARKLCKQNFYRCEDCPFAEDCWTEHTVTDSFAKKIFNTDISKINKKA